MIYVNRFFFNIYKQIRNIYLHSSIYNNKISKTNKNYLVYKPSPHLLSSLIKYQKKKIKIEDFALENIWNDLEINKKDFKSLNSFYWFFSLDLKSSKKDTRLVISNWIKHNHKYHNNSWEFDIIAKRIIAWLSCHNLTFTESNQKYQDEFNWIIQKQTNHLINEIKKSELIDDKLIGCAAIILVGICYQDEKNYLNFGLNILQKILKDSLDNSSFPKTRNIKQLIFYLKYYILIREWFKESQLSVPEFIDEAIYYLGKAYAFIWQNIGLDLLFNGNNNSNNSEFDIYLKRLGYNFKYENQEFGGYIILKDKKICLAMDAGSSPNSKFSKAYQAGALSFEIISDGKKLISNCGFFNFNNDKLNLLSKSSATHSTLTLDDHSSCNFFKSKNEYFLKKGLKVYNKSFIFEKNYWKITCSHDGYLKRYKSIHERQIEFFPKQMIFVGNDKIIKKKSNNNYKFDIRFHTEPNIKLMKTQDNKTILIQLNDEGWKFTCQNFEINIDNGLYFGNKNSYTNNQNFFITGISNNQVENIKWEIKKIK